MEKAGDAGVLNFSTVLFYISACNVSVMTLFLGGIYIATIDCWRPCQSWPVLEGKGVAILGDSYDFGVDP